ncbi:MAG: hypothetical protein CME70_19900 [Halobacteriovorax sp.]|nr:hypothetical protein [Halobacteriovorax sp.]|tara:strand:+ start:41678 stop:42622 length:945 start_codon:yes stop_codon:yes gene_type:complete
MFSIPLIISKSIEINKPAPEVFDYLSDFKNWQTWSPWICMEPSCPVSFEGNPTELGHRQSWDGKFIGSGTMSLIKIIPNKVLSYDLRFLKPWKSESKTQFVFEETSAGTKVTWNMQGSLPFFLFFFKKMMTALITMDYDRGLNMLKEVLETGSTTTKTSYDGVTSQDSFHYVGIRRTCKMDDMPSSMEEDFQTLNKLIEDGKIKSPKLGLSFYHKYDFVKSECDYTSGYIIEEPAINSTELNLVSGTVKSHKGLKVKHLGPYKHLGNAWTAAQTIMRSQKMKCQKGIHPYEIYRSMPGKVLDTEIETDIYIPVK